MARQNIEYGDQLKQGTDKLNAMTQELYDSLQLTAQVIIDETSDPLTTSAYGKLHLLTGTSANYPVDLPTAVSHAGESIAFKGVRELTKVVTLDGNSTEEIDGALGLEMYSGRFVVLTSDGANWVKTVDTAKRLLVAIAIPVPSVGLVLTNQSNTVQFLGNGGSGIAWVDASDLAQVRILTRHITNGAASSKLYPSYSIDGTNYLDPGTTTTGHSETISMGSGALAQKATTWITIPEAARIDGVLFGIRMSNGDGALDPVLGNTYLEFR